MKITKLNVLEFIDSKEMIEPWELRDEFGYTGVAARVCLSRLKKRGLVINMTRGKWELTVAGIEKLIHAGRR